MSDETRETPGNSSDRVLLELILKELDHIDAQLHDICHFIDSNRDVLARAKRVLHNPVADYIKHRPRAAGKAS